MIVSSAVVGIATDRREVALAFCSVDIFGAHRVLQSSEGNRIYIYIVGREIDIVVRVTCQVIAGVVLLARCAAPECNFIRGL